MMAQKLKDPDSEEELKEAFRYVENGDEYCYRMRVVRYSFKWLFINYSDSEFLTRMETG